MRSAKPTTKNKSNTGEQKKHGTGLLTNWKAFLLALAITLGLVYLGGILFPPREDHLYQFLWIGVFAVIALFYLANFLFYRHLNDLFTKRKLPEIHETLLKKQKNIEEDFRRASKRLHRSFLFAWIWYVLMLALVCFGALLVLPTSLPIPVVLLNCYLLWGLLSIWFQKQADEPPTLALSEEDYPVIHSLVREAAQKADCRMTVKLYAGGSSIGILRKPKEIWILLDAVTCALYTKEELYNVLLHEFAHEFNEDTMEALQAGRALERWGSQPEGVLTRIGSYLLNIPAGVVSLEYTYYNLFASRHKEELADKLAVKWGNAQALVNSLAKLSVWSIFEQNTPVPELTLYAEYERAVPPEDIPARAIRIYHGMLPLKRDEWRQRLEIELPPRVSSHPIFRARREAFGVSEYSFEDLEIDPAFVAETEAMLTLTGKAIAEQMAKDYQENRKHYYLERKELIDRAKAVTDWTAVTMDDRIEMAKALAVLEPELEETVIRSIREEDPENAYGYMLLGAKRFRENDHACVELLQQAAQHNHNFVEPAYDMIGDYARMNGEREILEQYRAEVADVVQEARDTSDSLVLKWKGQEGLSENDLPEAQFEANRQAILERTEGKLIHLYSVKKPMAEEDCFYYFLEFDQALDREERRRLEQQVFLYLDYCEEMYFLEDLTDQPKKREYLLKHVSDCDILQR